MEEHLDAAYRLRNLRLHEGASFGSAVNTGYPDSFVPGELRVPDKRVRDATKDAPTFVGLERLMRYAILKRLGRPGIPQRSQPSRGRVGACGPTEPGSAAQTPRELRPEGRHWVDAAISEPRARPADRIPPSRPPRNELRWLDAQGPLGR